MKFTASLYSFMDTDLECRLVMKKNVVRATCAPDEFIQVYPKQRSRYAKFTLCTHPCTQGLLIQQWALPGTHIISDGWVAYKNLNQLNDSVYLHDVVIHDQNFVDPIHPNMQTQNVENTFSEGGGETCDNIRYVISDRNLCIYQIVHF